MDWFAWLSKTGLEPSLVYDYGIMFSDNELEEEDTIYFTHDFLQSMGISIAKHRIEILKLVKTRSQPFLKLVAAIKNTRKYVSRRLRSFLSHQAASALPIVPRATSKERSWKVRKAMRFMQSTAVKPRRLLQITGGRRAGGEMPNSMKIGPAIPYEYESGSTSKREQIQWASMFQDLKPT